MLRKILAGLGIVEILSPQKLIDAAEAVAMENPGECELRSWVLPGARLEGFVILVAAARSEESYASLKRFLGVVGLLALLFPRAYVDYGSELAYEDASTCEWKPWVYPATRVVGLLYVLGALATYASEGDGDGSGS